ncbi:MAG: leucine-rich repeat protein, partial [Clostridia bacterium]|nr:leucine-rich repeat protein [Clostridia bacterium]
MKNRLKLPILLLMITAIVLTVLVSCTSVGIASVQVKDGCDYKTEYVIGEELDLTGIELVVTRTDGEVYSVFATDVREHLKIMNFKTDVAVENLNVILEYKGVATNIVVNVKDQASAGKKYTVSFATGEGQRVDPITAVEYGFITAPTDPVREGYAFDGWYKEESLYNAWNFNIDKVVADTTLYAKWSRLYEIKFKYSDEYNDEEDVVKYVKEGENLIDIPALPPVKGMVGKWDREAFTNVHENIVVNAIYVRATFTVVFYYMDVDGITPIELKTFKDVPYETNLAELYAEEIANIDVPAFSADGTKHFVGWSIKFDNVVSDLNVGAVYETNKYDVHFMNNYDGSDNSEFTKTTGIVYNNPVNSPEQPERAGYEFDGWYKNRECTDGNAWNFDTDRVKEETKLYAKWIKLYYVTFIVDGAEYGKVAVREGGNANKLPLPEKEGHTAEWYIGESPLRDDSLINVTQDKEVVAVFTIKEYQVTFFNYNREIIDVQTVEYGADAVRPAVIPQRLGYKFVSWGEVEDEVENEYLKVRGNVEVVARFEADIYVVRIVPNIAGQDASSNIQVVYDALVGTYNSEASSKLELSYSGYHFDGWYTDGAFQKSWNLVGDFLNVDTIVAKTVQDSSLTEEQYKASVSSRFESEEDQTPVLTLYAKWLKIHTVQLYDENDVAIDSIKVIDGNLIDATLLPAISEIEGKTGSWCASGSNVPYDFNTPVTGNMSLVIYYATKSYTVNFYLSVGDLFYSVQVEYNSSVENTISNPETTLTPGADRIVGKEFKGWDKLFSQIITTDTDYMAVLTPILYNVTWRYNGIDYAVTQVEHGKQAVFPTSETLPVYEGHRLASWSAVDSSLDINNVLSDMIVSPNWVVNTYTLTFVDKETNEKYLQYDGRAYVESQTKTHGQGIEVDTTVPNPSKAGKDFTGWSIGSLNVRYDDDANVWVLDSEYGNDGEYSISGESVSIIIKGDKFYYSKEKPQIIAGMIASNWDDNRIIEFSATEGGWVANGSVLSQYKSISFNGSFFYVLVADSVLYSNHTTSVYEISYVTNTDTLIDAKSYEHGRYSVAPADVLEKDGYVFIGWYTEPEFKNKYTFGTQVTSDMILYARWEAKRAYTEDASVVYTLNDAGTAYTLTDAKNYTGSEVVVANFYGNPGLPVDSIGAEAFAGNSTIRALDLPGTIVNIGPGAFMNMTALQSISIPESVAIIPDNAFNGASSLASVNFGEYPMVTTIGKNAFAKNVSLASITIPNSVTTIESGAFFNCTAFTEIEIPESVIAIGDNAFAGATGLRYAIFKRNTPANLGANVFQNYTSLQNAFRIYTPNVTLYTSNAANENWKALRDKIYDLNNVIKTDGKLEWAYATDEFGEIVLVQYLGAQTEVTVPESVVIANASISVSAIGDYAFDGRITSISFNASVGIKANTFASTDALYNLSITVGSVNAINPDYLYGAYSNVVSLNTLSISPTVTISELFGGNAPTALTTVKTLAGANNVMSEGFLANCVYVKEVIISGRTENVSSMAFQNCTALERIVFDNRTYTSLKSIGTEAFSGAISLANFEILTNSGTSYGIPETVTTIGANAFNGTKWLNANSGDMIIVGDGILYHYNGSASVVSIPASVKSITAGAFSGNAKLREVYFDDIANSALVEIGANAFANCVNLEFITLPASVETIGASAFEGDNKLATIVAFSASEPDYIGQYAFSNVHKELKVYSSSALAKWYGFDNVSLQNITIFEEESGSEKSVWVYGDALGGHGIVIVKALGVVGEETTKSIVISEKLNNIDVYEIADYALPRTLERLEYSIYVKNIGAKPFGGVTNLTDITLSNSYNENRISKDALTSLFAQNAKVSVLNTVANKAFKDLINGILPENIKTVNVLPGATLIADFFLEDNIYVENVTITEYEYENGEYKNPSVVKLEDTINGAGSYKIENVGSKAFRNTQWMKNYDGEYIIVLGSNLVDYKGVNSVLSIPEGVEYVNGSLFENDTFVEIITMPASVKSIGARAFAEATSLTKLFFNGATAPQIAGDTFDAEVIGANGVQIFVPAGSESASYGLGNWQTLPVYSNAGIKFIKNQISSGQYEEYIINTASGELLLARKYKVTYTDGLVTEIEENSTAIAPKSIVEKATGSTYNVSKLGRNVFMRSTKDVVIDIATALTQDDLGKDFSLRNLGDLTTLTIGGVKEGFALRAITANQLVAVIDTHNVLNVAYDGNVTLSALLGKTGGIESLAGVKIIDGVTETVDELLKGWSDISSVTFPVSIKKVGVNALEDTAWYKNYKSSVYGNDFVVLGGSLLYRYKGSATQVVIPNEVLIVNTGAFSTYNGSEWSSALHTRQIRFELGSNAHTILDYAFAGCSQLISIALPTSMRNVAASAFEDTGFVVTDGMLIVSADNDQEATLVKFVGDESNLDANGILQIPSKVKKIASGAFKDVTFLKGITHKEDSLLSIICEDAFNGATALETVNVPSGVVSIGKNAFYNTLWLGKALRKGEDVVIGGVLYQRVTTGATYTLNSTIISVVEDALVPIEPFTIGGETYSTQEEVRATALQINNGAYIPQKELYSILSKEWM